MMPLYDMHCHLDFASNTAVAVEHLDALGVGAFAVGVLPDAGVPPAATSASAESPSWPWGKNSPDPEISPSCVRFGVGLHPWWVADGRAGTDSVEAAVAAVAANHFVGEVGLDFGRVHGINQGMQRTAFERMARAASRAGNRVLSIHAVGAAAEVLDILDSSGALANCACIFHWYSGSSAELHRAVRAGCYFSVGDLMLQSKAGREYARQIPARQLLLETDCPPQGQPYEVAAMQAQLAATLRSVAASRNVDVETLAETVNQTSFHLLSSAS